MAIHVRMAWAFVETLVLAGVLLVWAERVRGARLLTLILLAWTVLPAEFVLGVAVVSSRSPSGSGLG